MNFRNFVAARLIWQRVLKRPKSSAVFLSRLPRDSISDSAGSPLRRHARTLQRASRVIALAGVMRRQRTGTHFCGTSARMEENHHAQREGGETAAPLPVSSSKGPLAEEEPSRGQRWKGTVEGMINTRALFSDFLPRDPRAQIACK